jgi:uncharacterized glyoxalase superfamily protein PhnB
VYGEDAIHAGEVDEDAAADGDGVSLEAGTGAPGDDGQAVLVGVSEDVGDFLGGLRPDNDVGRAAGQGGLVEGVLFEVSAGDGNAVGVDPAGQGVADIRRIKDNDCHVIYPTFEGLSYKRGPAHPSRGRSERACGHFHAVRVGNVSGTAIHTARNWIGSGEVHAMTLAAPTPVLRIFDYALAKSCYVDWLGFRIDWEHQFDGAGPRYVQVSRDAAVLHLSEHWGDSTPGSRVYIVTDDVEALHHELHSRPNANMHPGMCDQPWGTREMEVLDPFGNRLTFSQRIGER